MVAQNVLMLVRSSNCEVVLRQEISEAYGGPDSVGIREMQRTEHL